MKRQEFIEKTTNLPPLILGGNGHSGIGAGLAWIRWRHSTDAPESAQIAVSTTDQPGRMGHAEAQVVPPLAAGSHHLSDFRRRNLDALKGRCGMAPG
jgi:hypothetical protein